jgi:hypothetical protein
MGKGLVRPNFKYAHDECVASGMPEAHARVDRLVEWSSGPEAQGVDGLGEFMEAVR